MVSLFQQFLASMGNKDMAGKSQVQGQNIDQPKQTKMSEQEKTKKDVPVKEITESSAQGEARGMNLNSGPYCYRCLTRGHPKEECSVTSYCEICESAAHVKGQCPLLKKAKSTYA
jgi:hypothetical protein